MLRLSITQPGQSELLLERSDEGWVASQDDFAVGTADSLLSPILEALAQIRSIRIVETQKRDTLLLLPNQSIHVEVLLKNGRKEHFDIGREILENKAPATFVEIDRHEGIYLTDKHLRQIFARSIDDFRSKVMVDIIPEKVVSFQILRPETDTLMCYKSDTSSLWHASYSSQMLSTEQVQEWLKNLQQLNGLPFASHTDERLAADKLVASITLELSDQEEPVVLQFLTTGLNTNGATGRKKVPDYVVHSSQNAFNFFALYDTTLANSILAPYPDNAQ